MELLVTVIEVVVLGPVCSQISPGPDIPSQTILGGLRNMREDQSEAEAAEVEVEDVFPPALVALSSLSHMSKSTDQNSECLKRASSRSLEALE